MKERISDRLTPPRGIPNAPNYRLPGDLRDYATGSIGGAPVWRMRRPIDPTMSSPCTCKAVGRKSCKRHQSGDALTQTMRKGADPDGFAVFGRFPRGLLAEIIRFRFLGEGIERRDILHVCGGTLSKTEPMTIDVRAAARPWVRADGRRLPFKPGIFRAVLIDPPYSDAYARNLYGVENPRPSHLLREAARVVAHGGRIAMLHVAVPFTPPGCIYIDHFCITTGMGYRARALTIYERLGPRLEGM